MLVRVKDAPLKTYLGIRTREMGAFDCLDHIARQLLARNLVERVGGEVPRPATQDEAPRPENQLMAGSAPATQPKWTLKIDPATYLSRWPNGAAAALARDILGKD